MVGVLADVLGFGFGLLGEAVPVPVDREQCGLGLLGGVLGAGSYRKGPRIFDDIDVQVVGLGVLGGRNLHDNRPCALQVVGLGILVVVRGEVVVVLVKVSVGELLLGQLFLRLPVGVTAMTRSGTTTLEQTGTGRAVEHPGRQGHVAGAPHRVAFADEHRNQHEQPEHHERNPQQRLRDAWHDDLLLSPRGRRWPARPGQSNQDNYTPVICHSQAPNVTRVALATVH